VTRWPRWAAIRARGAATYDNDVAGVGCGAGFLVVEFFLAAGGGVVGAQGCAAREQAVDTEPCADAGAGVFTASGHHLVHEVGVGQVGAGHADEIDNAV
jgi:hypothetical protein